MLCVLDVAIFNFHWCFFHITGLNSKGGNRCRGSMLAARATRIISKADVIAMNGGSRHNSIFADEEYFERHKQSDEDSDDDEVFEEVVMNVATCRKGTQNACNSTDTKAGMVIAVVMLTTILVSVIIIVLDSLNYQYCDNPCPVQLTNKSYDEEYPVEEQRKYIQRELDKSLGPKVNTVDIEPSGTAFFIVNVST